MEYIYKKDIRILVYHTWKNVEKNKSASSIVKPFFDICKNWKALGKSFWLMFLFIEGYFTWKGFYAYVYT